MKNDFLTNAFNRVRSRFRNRNDDDDSQDALQEAFCRLWSRRDCISELSQAEGLLVTVTKNIRIDNNRRQSLHQTVGLSDINDPPDTSDTTSQESAKLFKEVDTLVSRILSKRDREILYHRERDGWDFDEIAEMYGVSEANVRMIVSRSRKMIREEYRKRNKL